MNNYDKRGEILTWNELFNTLDVKTFQVYPSTHLHEVLDLLRTTNSEHLSCASCNKLNDEYLDEVVNAYESRSLRNGLEALGTAMQYLGLRLCYMKSEDNTSYTVWMHDIGDTEEFLNLYKQYLTRQCFFDNINTFALPHEEKLDDPSDDVDMDCFDWNIELTLPRSETLTPFILKGQCEYLCVPFRNCTKDGDYFNAIHLKTMTVCNNLFYKYDKENILPHIIHGAEVFMSHSAKYWVICKQKGGRWLPDFDAYDEEREDTPEYDTTIKRIFLNAQNKRGELVTYKEMTKIAQQENMTVYMQDTGNYSGKLFVMHIHTNDSLVKVRLPVSNWYGVPTTKYLWQNGHPYVFVGFSPSLWYVIDLENMEYHEHKDACKLTGQFICNDARVYLCMNDGRVLRMKLFENIDWKHTVDFSTDYLKEISRPNKRETLKKTPFGALRRWNEDQEFEWVYGFGEKDATIHVVCKSIT